MDKKKYGFIWDPAYYDTFAGERHYCQKLEYIEDMTKEQLLSEYPRDSQFDGNFGDIATIVTSVSFENYEIAYVEGRWQRRKSNPILVIKLKTNMANSVRGRSLPYARKFRVLEQWDVIVPPWDFVLANSIPDEQEPEILDPVIVVTQATQEVKDFNHDTLLRQLAIIMLGLDLGFEVYTPDYTKIKNKLGYELPIEVSRFNLAISTDSHEDRKVIEKIDVIWSKRAIPIHAYEIEGSTAIKSGLDRLNTLKQYIPHCKFHIVADINRRNEYMERKSSLLFKELDVNFMSYDHVSQLEALPTIDLSLLEETVYAKKMQRRLYINLENCTYEEALERLKKAYDK